MKKSGEEPNSWTQLPFFVRIIEQVSGPLSEAAVPERPTELNQSVAEKSTVARMLLSLAAAWVLSLGVDFLLHGGLLASHYVKPNRFLLEPQEAFRRIPLGYLAFLMLIAGLYWLLRQLNVRSAGGGFRLGASAGFVVWGALVLGLYSISTIELPLLFGWWLGQSLELGLAGAVLGAADKGTPLKRIWTIVAIVVLACVSLTIVLQSIGWSPPMRAYDDRREEISVDRR